MTEHPQPRPGEEDGRSEPFGPLTLTRHVKDDDDRTLILYERRPTDEASGDPEHE